MTTTVVSAAVGGLPQPTPYLAEKISAGISDLGYVLRVLTDEVTSITAGDPALDQIGRASAMARVMQDAVERLEDMSVELLRERQS